MNSVTELKTNTRNKILKNENKILIGFVCSGLITLCVFAIDYYLTTSAVIELSGYLSLDRLNAEVKEGHSVMICDYRHLADFCISTNSFWTKDSKGDIIPNVDYEFWILDHGRTIEHPTSEQFTSWFGKGRIIGDGQKVENEIVIDERTINGQHYFIFKERNDGLNYL